MPSLVRATVCSEIGESRPMTIPVKNSISTTEKELYSGSYALVVGASNYKFWGNPLDSVPTEQDAIAAALARQGFKVRKICDPQASGDGGLQEIRRFVDQYGKDSNRLVIYLSGHGWAENDNRKGYFAATDSPLPGEPARAFGFSSNNMLDLADRFHGKHLLVVVDACYSAAVFSSKGDSGQGSISSVDFEDISQSARSFLTAGERGAQTPSPSPFAVAFVLGMSGYADLGPPDGLIRGSELALWVRQKVSTNTLRSTVPRSGYIPSAAPGADDIGITSGDIVFRYDPAIKAAAYKDIGNNGEHELIALRYLNGLEQPVAAESSGLADPKYSVFYFEKTGDGPKVENALRRANIPFYSKGSILPVSGRTNGLACHPEAPGAVVRQAARALIEGGVELRIIDQATKRLAERRYVLQALEFKRVAPAVRPDLRPLTVADLEAIQGCPDEFLRRKGQ